MQCNQVTNHGKTLKAQEENVVEKTSEKADSFCSTVLNTHPINTISVYLHMGKNRKQSRTGDGVVDDTVLLENRKPTNQLTSFNTHCHVFLVLCFQFPITFFFIHVFYFLLHFSFSFCHFDFLSFQML